MNYTYDNNWWIWGSTNNAKIILCLYSSTGPKMVIDFFDISGTALLYSQIRISKNFLLKHEAIYIKVLYYQKINK